MVHIWTLVESLPTRKRLRTNGYWCDFAIERGIHGRELRRLWYGDGAAQQYELTILDARAGLMVIAMPLYNILDTVSGRQVTVALGWEKQVNKETFRLEF